MKKYVLFVLIYFFVLALIISCGGGGGGAVSFSGSNQLHNGGDAGGWGNGNTSGGGLGGGSASAISAEGGTFTPCTDIQWSKITLTITVTSEGATTTHTFDSGDKDAIAELLTSLKKGDVVSVSTEIEMQDNTTRTSSAGPITIGVGDNHISIPTPYKFECLTEMTQNLYQEAYDALGLTAPMPFASFTGSTMDICTINEIASKLPEATADGFIFDHWITQDGKTYTPGVTKGDVILSPVFKPDYTCDYSDLVDEILITNQQEFNDLMNTHNDKDFDSKAITLNCNVSTSTGFTNITDGFKGTFDGNGKTVTLQNITCIESGTSSYAGLFAKADSYFIGNVKVAGQINASTSNTDSYVGGIAGYNNGIITNCANTANISGNLRHTGGIAGLNSGGIYNCYNTGSISSQGTFQPVVGGIAGWTNEVIERCYNTGSITCNTSTSSRVGGIAGYVGVDGGSADIKYCYNIGLLNSSGTSGSLCGGSISTGIGDIVGFYYNQQGSIPIDGFGNITDGDFMTNADNLVTSGPSYWEHKAGEPYPTLKEVPY